MTNKKSIYISLLFTISVVICSVCAKNESRCEPITSWVCKNIGYNFTTFPNAMNHQTQEDAHLDMVSFSLLIDTQCSTFIRFFICSQYIPICIENYHEPLKPCRSICEMSRDECTPFWSLLNTKWPDEMACDLFPDETQELCLKSDNFVRFCDCSCKSPLIDLTENNGKYIANIGPVKNCTLPCKGVFFTDEQRNFADIWIQILSAVSFICTFITLVTFITEAEKPKYPEKSIKYLAFCSSMMAIGFLCSKIMDRNEVTCDGLAIKFSSTNLSSCTILSAIIYYFGMATTVWWMILSFTWFTAAGLKWSSESIEKYFHCIAWVIPAIQTVAVIRFRAIDADHVAGICYVGNLNMVNLKVFVVIPSIIYIMIGTLFLLIGFLLLAHEMHSNKPTTERLIHIGVLSALYMVTASIIIGCQLYEITFYDEWMTDFTCPCNKTGSKPLFSVFLLKYFMILTFGAISIIWIWIGERFISWKHFVPQYIQYDRNRVVHTLLNENNITYNT